MKTWDVLVRWDNGESTHVIGFGADEDTAVLNATESLDIDKIVSAEVLGEVNITREAKQIIDLMKELYSQGAQQIYFGAMIDDDRTVKDVLREQFLEYR